MTTKRSSYYTIFNANSSMIKRIFDITFSIIGIVLTFPLMIIIAILIGENPLYRGVRIGQFGKHFRMMKFRSMVINADKIGGASTPGDDSRITKIGKYLRKLKLDELPQLFHILTGRMSFVGPRAEVKEYIDMLLETERETILSVKPGLLDLATLENMSEGERLRGSDNPEKDYMEKIRPMKVRLQIEYVKTRSFMLDLKILIMGLWRLIF